MRTLLAPLVIFVPLLALPAAARPADPPADLELASLAVTDGIVGGFVGRFPRARLALRYDRTVRVFRALRRREGPDGPEVWVADLTPEGFRALLELAVEAGLPGLPLEDPPSCTDVYGRNLQVRLAYKDVLWANGAPEGCVSSRSTVQPSADERRRFDAVVARLEEAVDALPLRRGWAQELERVPFLGDARALRSHRRVMRHVLADPLRHRLDLENVSAWEGFVGFYWRGQAGGDHGWDVVFTVDGEGALGRYPPSPFREGLVPVETGMTRERVLELLGQPERREELACGDVLLTYRRPTPGMTPDRCTRLRFEDGRLAAP